MRTRRLPINGFHENLVPHAIAAVTLWITLIVSALALIH
jgi:hypothetical protein